MPSSKFLLVMAIGSLIAGSAFAGNQGTTITVTKTARSGLTQTDTYSWTIQKTLKPDQRRYIIREGQTVNVDFLLTATRSGPVTTYENTALAGEICVTNTGTQPTVGFWLTDEVEESSDSGATWHAFAGPQVIPVSELAPGEHQCYNYSFDVVLNPNALYQNIARASIDNFVDFEGEEHTVTEIVPVTVGKTVIEVNKEVSIDDNVTCPTGFACVPNAALIGPFEDYPTQVFTVAVTNVSATCGELFPLTNTATLVSPTRIVPVLGSASATATIYSGTCRVGR